MRKLKLLTVTVIGLSFLVTSLSGRYSWQQRDGQVDSRQHESVHDTHKGKRKVHQGPTVVAHVDGMVCDFCARGLEKVFQRKKEVKNTIVSLEQGTVTLQMKGDRMLSDDVITELIEDNGMTVRSIDHGDMSVREKMMDMGSDSEVHMQEMHGKGKSKRDKK